MSPKKQAIIVDLDGTLANDFWRKHTYLHPDRNWDEINAMSRYDAPNVWCQELVWALSAKGYHVVFLTARSSNARSVTEQWLLSNVGPTVDYSLIMRDPNDTREDWMFKETAYYTEIAPNYEVLMCVDDKQSVVDMWRRLGLTCLQCAP